MSKRDDLIRLHGSEHAHQSALFAWCAVAKMFGANVADAWNAGEGFEAAKSRFCNDIPIHALANLFAIPNGDQRGDGSAKGAMIAGARLKAEGQRNGVPDIFLAWPKLRQLETNEYCRSELISAGLFIEMKKPGLQTHKNGGCSDEQMQWHKQLVEAGYAVKICYSWLEARDAILQYLQ